MKFKYHRQLNRFIRKQLRKRGFLIRRINMLDRRDVCNDPRQILYYGGSHVIINVPVEKGRRKIFPVTADWDPFYCALQLCDRHGGDTQVLHRVLSAYYSMVQPQNALQWLGLEYEDAPQLAQAPPWAAPPP